MLKLKKVAVTGGISAGKSTVCRFFKELGAYVVSADEIAHRLLSLESTLGQKLVKLFGVEIITDNKINRRVIADKVFKNQKLLKELEKLLHPLIISEMKKQYEQVEAKQSAALFVAEIPLLFEAKYDSWYDATICVISEEKNSEQRFVKATGNSEEEFQLRLKNQMPPEEKAKKANFILSNNGDLSSLRKQVVQLYEHLTKL